MISVWSAFEQNVVLWHSLWLELCFLILGLGSKYLLVIFPSSHSQWERLRFIRSFCTKTSPWQSVLVCWGRLARLPISNQMDADFLVYIHMTTAGLRLSSPVFYPTPTLTISHLSLFQPITTHLGNCYWYILFLTWALAWCYHGLDLGITFCSPSNSFISYCSYCLSLSVSLHSFLKTFSDMTMSNKVYSHWLSQLTPPHNIKPLVQHDLLLK